MPQGGFRRAAPLEDSRLALPKVLPAEGFGRVGQERAPRWGSRDIWEKQVFLEGT